MRRVDREADKASDFNAVCGWLKSQSSRTSHERKNVEKKKKASKFACALRYSFNGIPSPLGDRQGMRPSGPLVAVTQSESRLANRAQAHVHGLSS